MHVHMHTHVHTYMQTHAYAQTRTHTHTKINRLNEVCHYQCYFVGGEFLNTFIIKQYTLLSDVYMSVLTLHVTSVMLVDYKICTCIHLAVHTHTHTRTHTHTLTHTHTHTHTHTNKRMYNCYLFCTTST